MTNKYLICILAIILFSCGNDNPSTPNNPDKKKESRFKSDPIENKKEKFTGDIDVRADTTGNWQKKQDSIKYNNLINFLKNKENLKTIRFDILVNDVTFSKKNYKNNELKDSTSYDSQINFKSPIEEIKFNENNDSIFTFGKDEIYRPPYGNARFEFTFQFKINNDSTINLIINYYNSDVELIERTGYKLIYKDFYKSISVRIDNIEINDFTIEDFNFSADFNNFTSKNNFYIKYFESEMYYARNSKPTNPYNYTSETCIKAISYNLTDISISIRIN